MKIEIKKFGTILNSRPAGRDAALTIKAYIQPNTDENIELDFSGIISVGPSWLDEVLTYLRNEYGKDRVICLATDNASVNESLKVIDLP
jgi:hypothetical protein